MLCYGLPAYFLFCVLFAELTQKSQLGMMFAAWEWNLINVLKWLVSIGGGVTQNSGHYLLSCTVGNVDAECGQGKIKCELVF